MTKTARARYTPECKQEAVRLGGSGQNIAATARTLDLVEQTLFTWVKAKREGKLFGADCKAVSAEQMEISWLRASWTLAYASPVPFEQDWLANQARKANACARLWGTDSRGKVSLRNRNVCWKLSKV